MLNFKLPIETSTDFDAMKGKIFGMKNLMLSISSFFLVSLLGCQKENSLEVSESPLIGFTEYTIPKNKSYSVDSMSVIPVTGVSEMKFLFRFDASAIYTTVDPMNQYDINKLYGFADCVSFTTLYTIAPHHINSARFGWAWLNQSLRIYGYCYNDSVRISKELQTVAIGKTYAAGIKIFPGGYEFTIDNKKDTLSRICSSTSIIGYKLFPYFGGTETAPQEVHIWIKEL